MAATTVAACQAWQNCSTTMMAENMTPTDTAGRDGGRMEGAIVESKREGSSIGDLPLSSRRKKSAHGRLQPRWVLWGRG